MRVSLGLPAALALMAGGCSGGGARVAPVSGRITLDGKPLPNATVTFQPTGAGQDINPGPGSYGKTDADGRYVLRVVGEEKDGAYVGKHRVEIVAFARERVNPDDDRERAPPNLVPAKYNRNTTLFYEVKPGENTADFPLTSK